MENKEHKCNLNCEKDISDDGIWERIEHHDGGITIDRV